MQKLACKKVWPEQVDIACIRSILKQLKQRKYYKDP